MKYKLIAKEATLPTLAPPASRPSTVKCGTVDHKALSGESRPGKDSYRTNNDQRKFENECWTSDNIHDAVEPVIINLNTDDNDGDNGAYLDSDSE